MVIKAKLVSGNEGSFGRAPRMKSNQVETMLFTGINDTLPRLNICWRIAGLWEDTAFQRSPHESGAAVEDDAIFLCRYLSHTKDHLVFIITG